MILRMRAGRAEIPVSLLGRPVALDATGDLGLTYAYIGSIFLATTALTIGVDRELMPNLGVAVAYSWNRTTRYAYDPWNGVGPDDYELASTVTAPDGRSINVYRPIPAAVTAGGNGRIRTNFDGYSTRYNGVDFTLTKRLSNRWMARVAASYNNATQHYDDANLVLRLYDMRREERLRKARAWFAARGEYSKLLHEDMTIRAHILKQQRAASISIASRAYWNCTPIFTSWSPRLVGMNIENVSSS